MEFRPKELRLSFLLLAIPVMPALSFLTFSYFLHVSLSSSPPHCLSILVKPHNFSVPRLWFPPLSVNGAPRSRLAQVLTVYSFSLPPFSFLRFLFQNYSLRAACKFLRPFRYPPSSPVPDRDLCGVDFFIHPSFFLNILLLTQSRAFFFWESRDRV